MNQKNTAVIMFVILMLSACFVTVASAEPSNFFTAPQNSDNLHQLGTIPIAVVAGLHSNASDCLNQPTRNQIYVFIKDNPGVHFRGICDGLCLSVGVVQYHLDVLGHAGLIVAYADGQNVRFFLQGAFSETDMQLISLMRHQTTGQILLILAQNENALHRDIAATLGLSSQALTWQINQLREAGYVCAEKTGVNVAYNLKTVDIGSLILSFSEQLRLVELRGGKF
ncbi:MAG: winged helix-turn-helix transcriptional regulator [Candidatus Bathyarchaeota archaeon]|nr:winged helix-turn-helix transcriptional regulator [Candidatus Bathyarchaeota archaeon]